MTGWLLVAGDFTLHGGMDRANLELARFLAVDDPVHLVAHRADPILNGPNVTIHRARRPFGKHLFGQPLLARAGWKWAERLTRDGFRVIVNGGNCLWPDANWVHYVHAAAPRPRSRGFIRRFIAPFERSMAVRAERRALQVARVVVCNSHRTARDVIELVGVREERVKVVYLGMDPELFEPIAQNEREASRKRLGWDDRPWVVFVGALGDSRKGFDTLFSAWRELCRDPNWDANLAVVGAGATLPGWKEQSIANGLTARIAFLGYRTDVPEILSACDLLVHPARYEPYGLAPHEAICRSLPAVVTAASGISERYPVDLADLILNDPDSSSELASRLRHWRVNDESFAARVRPLSERLRSRTWADMAREIRDTVLDT